MKIIFLCNTIFNTTKKRHVIPYNYTNAMVYPTELVIQDLLYIPISKKEYRKLKDSKIFLYFI